MTGNGDIGYSEATSEETGQQENMQPLLLIHCITKIDSSHATLLDSPPFIQDASEMEMTVWLWVV